MSGTRALAKSMSSVVLVSALTACSGGSQSEVIGSDDTSTDTDGEEASASPSGDATPVAELRVESGFTSGVDSIGTRYSLAGARVTNPNPEAAAYDVQVLFNLVDANGDVLDTQSEAVPYVAAGGSVPVAPLQIGFDLKKEPKNLQVRVVGDFEEDEGPRGEMGGEAAILKVKSAQLQAGDFGTELTAQVSNPTDTVAEYASWACIYLRGTRIVGGSSSTIVDPIPPDATVEFGEMLPLDLEASKVECQVIN